MARTSKIRKPPWEKISRPASPDFEKRGNFCVDSKCLEPASDGFPWRMLKDAKTDAYISIYVDFYNMYIYIYTHKIYMYNIYIEVSVPLYLMQT